MKTTFFILLSALFINSGPFTASTESKDFQGKAYYFSQSKMELGNWGARMSEAQKKQMKERLKNRLEKTFVLSFNKEASFFKDCLLYTSPSPRDAHESRMPSSA